jgi:RNA polymerase sigma factor (sigma-70 family)
VEVSALTHGSAAPGLRGPSPLLRLQPDERLVALTRRGHHAAFEVLCARYQARLLSFTRHMLGSREDAEDVLQEVFAAAFNAVLADEREINVRPWLYRIARNRSLNHLRRATAVGVDSMDVHFADHGLSTGDRVLRRESFRELLADVHQLPETQRTALLLREIDALSYEQIAHAMETTVPSVKSLLVRARISLAEAAEARKLSCEEVRLELGEAAEGLIKVSPPGRRHVRDCDRCRAFKRHLKSNNHALAAILPVGPIVLLKKLLLAKLSSTASAGSAHVASGAGATVGAGAVASAGAAGSVGASGVFTVGAGALATKAVAGLAAAAIVSAGAVAANQPSRHRHHAAVKTAYAPAPASTYEPVVVSERAQPLSLPAARPAAIASRHAVRHRVALVKPPVPTTAVAPAASVPAASTPGTPPAGAPAGKAGAAPGEAPPVTQLTTETTQLPSSATGAPPAPTAPPAPGEASPGPGSPAPTSGPTVSPTTASGPPAPSASSTLPAATQAPPAPATSSAAPAAAPAIPKPAAVPGTRHARHHTHPPARVPAERRVKHGHHARALHPTVARTTQPTPGHSKRRGAGASYPSGSASRG